MKGVKKGDVRGPYRGEREYGRSWIEKQELRSLRERTGEKPIRRGPYGPAKGHSTYTRGYRPAMSVLGTGLTDLEAAEMIHPVEPAAAIPSNARFEELWPRAERIIRMSIAGAFERADVPPRRASAELAVVLSDIRDAFLRLSTSWEAERGSKNDVA